MSSCSINKNTLTFDELVKGWTSFHSFSPDNMIGMNNQFFSFKGGELYLHNSDEEGRSFFYGEQFPTKISLMVNDSPKDVKELLAVSLEGNKAWDVDLTAFISSDSDNSFSSLAQADFVKKEGFWYAYARRNEDTTNTNSKSVYGIGQVTFADTLNKELTINGYSSSLTTGDTIRRGSDNAFLGTVVSFNRNENVTKITLNDFAETIFFDDYVFGVKDSRAEGGNLRGYNIKLDLSNTTPDKLELFAVNSEVIKSYT